MFKITIEGNTLEEFHANLQQLAAQFGGVPTATPKPARKAAAKKDEPQLQPQDPEEPEETVDLDDEELEPAQPMPETAKQVVDAGTGKPVSEPVKMTVDDVRVAAAKLAAKDATKLGEILKTHGATKLSEVPKGKLPAFAADVMEALG